MDVSPDGDTLCVAGDFALVNGRSGRNAAAEALAIVSSTLSVGGHFTTVGGTDRDRLAALSASGGLQAWDPGANGVFGAFGAAITSGRVAFGGEFTLVSGDAHQGGRAVRRNRMARPAAAQEVAAEPTGNGSARSRSTRL